MIPKYEDIYLKLVFIGTYIADPEVSSDTKRCYNIFHIFLLKPTDSNTSF